MDAVGHAVITASVSDSPLAVVASAINLRYRQEGIERLLQMLPPEYAAMVVGIRSHIETNKYVHHHPFFLEMRKQARGILTANGIRDLFSHVAVEAAIDYLLMQEKGIRTVVEKAWQEFNWDAALHYLRPFSRSPEMVATAIPCIRQRLNSIATEDFGRRLEYLARRNGCTPAADACIKSMAELSDVLRISGDYQQLIQDAKLEMQRQLRKTI